jgi:hypothetical protein
MLRLFVADLDDASDCAGLVCRPEDPPRAGIGYSRIAEEPARGEGSNAFNTESPQDRCPRWREAIDGFGLIGR